MHESMTYDTYDDYKDAVEHTLEVNILVDTFKDGHVNVCEDVQLDDYKPLSFASPDLAHRIIIRTEKQEDDDKDRIQMLDVYQYNGFTEEVHWKVDRYDVFTGFQMKAYNNVLMEGQVFYKNGDLDTGFHVFPTSPETLFVLNTKLFTC